MFVRKFVAKKDVNIVSSLVGKGLELEALLLKELLNGHDVYCVLIHYCNWANAPLVRADVNVFLEVVHPLAFSLSRENWIFPNSEWWDARNDQFLPRFTRILCKTHDCERIWKEKLAGDRPERVMYTGFLTRDLYRPDVPREDRFLHVAGESEFKGTAAVIGAWRDTNWAMRPFPLTVVTRQKKYQDLCEGVPGITWYPRVTEDELATLMNSHRFHVMPCEYEGYGHALHEGIGCGALMLTTAAPPMNEFAGIVPEWTVAVAHQTPRALAQLNHVEPMAVQVAAYKAIQTAENANGLRQRSAAARAAFLADNAAFTEKFLGLVGVA
jgi:hypothetical protein